MAKCFRCGEELILSFTEYASWRGIADATEEDDSIVECYQCKNCGANYEVDYPIQSMEELYPFYKE